MKKFATCCFVAVLVLSAVLPAVASPTAPRYQSSEPSDGATVHRPPDRVEVTFDEPLDGSSRLLVRDECDRRVDDGTTDVETNTMSIGLSKKPSGVYHVEYTAVGLAGITGTSTGHFTFTAHGGESCDGERKSHNHNKNKNKHKEKHKGHNKGRHKGNGPHDEDHDRDDHSSTGDHEDHSGDATTHGGHDGNGNGQHSDHSDGNGDALASGDVPGITSQNDTARRLLSRADSSTLLLALGLCLALGMLGGAILRASAAR